MLKKNSASRIQYQCDKCGVIKETPYSAFNRSNDCYCHKCKLGISGEPEVARYLIQFDQEEILDIYSNKIGNSSYEVYFKNFIAEAQGLNQNTFLELLPIAQSWNNGTGYYGDNPAEQDGALNLYINGVSGE